MDTSSLMEQILSKENLNAAYLQVVRNKGAAGVDGMTVEELGAYLSENGENIREQLRTRKYKPQPVRRVEIPKPDGGVRNLGVPTVVDRFVQQAVAQVLTPIFEEQFHDHSYGFRPNRCAQQAVLKALEMMNDGHSCSLYHMFYCAHRIPVSGKEAGQSIYHRSDTPCSTGNGLHEVRGKGLSAGLYKNRSHRCPARSIWLLYVKADRTDSKNEKYLLENQEIEGCNV